MGLLVRFMSCRGKATKETILLGRAYGVAAQDVIKLLEDVRQKVPMVEDFVRDSLLTTEAQTEYLRIFHDRLRMFS